jgi:hypothetical protein
VWRSQFCLFLVVFPVSCISSVSPRFYFRKHAFCFLPLASILEMSNTLFLKSNFKFTENLNGKYREIPQFIVFPIINI